MENCWLKGFLSKKRSDFQLQNLSHNLFTHLKLSHKIQKYIYFNKQNIFNLAKNGSVAFCGMAKQKML